MRDQGNLSAATRTYSQALALDPLSPSILEGQALLIAYQGRFERATAQLREVTSTHPTRVVTLLMLGRIALLSGDYDEALSATDQAEVLAPSDAVVLALRVDALTRLSRVDAARASLDRAITQAAENEIVLLATLNFHFLSGDYEALEAAAEERASLVLANAGFEGTDMYRERLVWAAVAKLALGQAEKARDLLEKALPDSDGLYPTPLSVHNLALLVRSRFLTGDLVGAASAADNARAVAERARLEGCAPAALDYALAAVAAAAEDYTQAAVHFRSAVGAGWRDLVFMTHDPAVAGFLNTPEYRELVESGALRGGASETHREQ